MSDIELTDDERKNGWTEATLKAYVVDRERAQAGIVMFNPDYRQPARPRWANSSYDPLRWR